MKFRWLIWTCLVLGAVSCKDKQPVLPTPQEQFVKDVAEIDQYLAENNIEAVQHPSGIRYVIQTVGTGGQPASDDCIEINYVGTILHQETPFETGTAIRGPMVRFIRGWRIGLKEVKKGGKITVYIPSGLAYGTQEQKRDDVVLIPKNSNLVFDVELLNYTKYNSAGEFCYPWP